jgi:spore germination protein KC
MKVSRLIVLFVLLLFVLTGCWNRRELSELAIVSAIAVDKGTKKNEYLVTFQIVNPSENATGVAGGGGKATPVFTVSETGTTIFEAIRKVSKKLSRQLFFAHIRLMVIDGKLAKEEGILDLFDLFERSHEARLTSNVLIARGTDAKSIINMVTPLDNISGYVTVKKLEATEKVWSENIKVEVDDVINGIVSQGSSPVISGVRIDGDPKEGEKKSNLESTNVPAVIEISGIAAFRGGKLVGWLDNGKAKGFMWVKNKMNSTIVPMDCKKKRGGIAIELTESKSSIKAEVHGKKTVFHIDIKEEGNVAEMNCPTDLSKIEVIKKLEKELAKETKKEVMSAVKFAQKKKSDIFGFGEAINRENPKAWGKMKNNWNSDFSKADVKVRVEAYIRRPGMIMKPYIKNVPKLQE